MKTYQIDGSAVASKADFFTEIGRAVNGEGGYFGSNLDALADCLRGGFGTPDDGKFRFVITSYKQVKAAVGEDVWSALLTIFTTEGVDLWLRA
ncbi:barstar family protein [Mycolicibacterium goodii]|uniref:Barstar family protein n=1 Tax=Mycolicibacterium goodii TaxID=134601 RepID=A0ABS6HUT0_MYCGD|nr:barstar family protein [Mycolicibacterium goodii]OKH68123.1 ribonuclease inhibitor [Mycobacterium sp. SWH-M5]MBU8810661.1 barstar family protein [Mycolicibacterium goodii]MBU8819026.1 barstar family protein [Mycolicibacterium goodii]MBU8826442.1 barstar family protein [Mycolicibacterium goodii]MBU8833576.1 barstar family protein [Mycolicibacterium goodii]